MLNSMQSPQQKQRPPGQAAIAHFKEFVKDAGHPCAMAKSVLANDSIQFGTYDRLGSETSARAMCEDLYRSLSGTHEGFWSFVALFPEEDAADEEQFERRLWRHLQRMHDFDAGRNPWDSTVSADPESAEFSFSIGGHAWYVIGLHPHASRQARRFGTAALVFNPHGQFEDLRSRGKYTTVRNLIRRRDIQLQGSLNPMLSDHGESSEARQYSGRAVPAEWKCPFHAARRSA